MEKYVQWLAVVWNKNTTRCFGAAFWNEKRCRRGVGEILDRNVSSECLLLIVTTANLKPQITTWSRSGWNLKYTYLIPGSRRGNVPGGLNTRAEPADLRAESSTCICSSICVKTHGPWLSGNRREKSTRSVMSVFKDFQDIWKRKSGQFMPTNGHQDP